MLEVERDAEQITNVVQEAGPFAQAHASAPSDCAEWAVNCCAGTREAFCRAWDNPPTTQTASHNAPQRIVFEQLDPLVPTAAGLSGPLH